MAGAGGTGGVAEVAPATAFAALFAGALLLHVLWWHGPVVASPWAAVAAAAAWLIARPSSVGRLALLSAAATVAIVAELPGLGSHLLLALAAATCVLVHLGARLVRGGRLPTGDELWPRLAPFLRAAVAVLYAAAVLSKLNDAYLDPATSPAGPLAGKVVWFAPVTLDGDWRASVAIWGSLVAEAALPVLLVVPRTRRVGLVLGLAFHGVLAASGTVPFTALMLAFYVGFLPTAAGREASGTGGSRSARALPAAASGATTGAVALGLLWLVGAGAGLEPGRVDGSVLSTLTRLVVLGAVVAAIGAVVRRDGSPWSGRRPVERRASGGHVPVGRLGGVFLAGVVVLVLCAASPYLGWRAGDAFTMYSGLRTAPGSWNHVLLPSAVRLRD